MQTDQEHTSSEAESDDALWSAIHRTWQEAAPLPDDDIRDLVARSMEAYWSGRKKEVSSEIKAETARIARRLAEQFRNPLREFWLDLVLAVIPVALVALTLGFEQRARIFLPGWSSSVLSVLSLGLAGGSFYWIRSRRPNPNWGWLRYSAGALAGGLIVASVVGPLISNQNRETLHVSLALADADNKMLQIGLLSLDSRQNGRFLRAEDSGYFSVSTTELNSNAAVYEANLAHRPGKVVASLSQGSGKVSWSFAGHEEERGRFVVGTVTSVDLQKLALKTSQGEVFDLRLDSRSGPTDLATLFSTREHGLGHQVVVAFETGTNRVLATRLVHEVPKGRSAEVQ